jgi:uncharacterized protein
MGRPVVHWELTARNVGKLEGFYSNLFEWSMHSDSPVRYRQVDTGTQNGITGGIAETDGSWPNGALFYVQVDDVKEYLRKAETLGASTLLPPTEVAGNSRIAIFRDPEGIPIGLMQSS